MGRCVFWCALAFAVTLVYSVAAALLLTGLLPAAVGLAAHIVGEATGDQFLKTCDNLINLFIQLGALAIFGAWWRALDGHAMLRGRRRGLLRGALARAQRVGGVVGAGVALQLLLSIVLTTLRNLAVPVMEEYTTRMDAAGTSEFTVLSLVVLAVGAPLLEELMCRGVMFEFALRAVTAEPLGIWSGPHGRRRAAREGSLRRRARRVSPRQFWCANLIQAALFGMAHGNVVQAVYATALGLVLGWVAWRTGRLRYNMLLHLTLNASSYAVDALWGVLAPFGIVVFIAVPVLVALWGIEAFRAGSVPVAGLIGAGGSRDAAAAMGEAPRDAAGDTLSC